MKKIIAILLAFMLVFGILPIGSLTASAATSGYYTYEVSNGKATITDCDESISGNVEIPSTLGGYPVTSIGNWAFSYCESLTSITIPDSVTIIGENAFRYCESLTSVTIGDSVTSIGESAFYYCTSLTSVTIPDSVTSIGSSAFDNTAYYNNSLNWENNVLYIGKHLIKAKTSISGSYTIKSGTRTIADRAFSYCSSLTSVTIPDSVTSIGDMAFYNCTSLTSVTIPDSVESLGEFVFSNCTSLTSVTIPDSVTSIGSSAFESCTSLTSITIPDSVESLGSGAFSGCTSLTKVNIKDIEAWCNISFGNYAANPLCCAENLYLNDNLVTNLVIPDSVESLGNYAFRNCTSLTSVTIPDSVTSIGEDAFYNCDSLTSVTIGDSVESLGSGAFYDCTSLTSITIPDSVESLGNYTFRNCTSLTSVTIPDSVTSIGSYAFYYCTSLTSVTIGDSVTSIGEWAFYNCTSLISVTIGDSVTSIGSYAFYNCYNLKNVYISDIEKWFAITLGNEYSNPMRYARNLYVNNLLFTDLYIAEDMQIIAENQYYGYGSIKNVFIPKSVILIKQNAFYACSGIENIYYEGTAEEWAEITIPSGNDYLKNATVYYNSTGIPGGITSVEISKLPDKVKYIENEEELDLAGGVLTVNYDGGATQDIDLATIDVIGFDNSVLGKQTITVKYGDFTAEFEVEIIPRPIAFIAVSTFPNIREYILGENLDLTGGKLAVGYLEGNYAMFDLTADMVSNYNMNKSGYQTVIVTYKGYITEFSIRVFKNGDIDGDDTINAIDITLIRTNLLENNVNSKRFDINQDNAVNVLDLVRLKKKLAGIIA